MAHFAHVTNGVVDSVIVIEPEVIEQAGGWDVPELGEFRPLSEWVQTSYNTLGGVHKLGGTPLRKNYAGKGYTYDGVRDAFIPPKAHDSWILDEDTCQYKAPKERPLDGKTYGWDEAIGEWVIRDVKHK